MGCYTSRLVDNVEPQQQRNSETKIDNVEAATKKGGRYLCQDIIVNILLRLPAESVVRFMSVCRDWRVMISQLDPKFVQQLMGKVMMILPTDNLLFDDHPTVDSKNVFFKLKENGIDGYFCYERVGIWVERTCKNFGLFRSETKDYGNRLFVYDAINHQYRQLPKFHKSGFVPNPKDIYSLVYDASAKTCKIIAFTKRRCSIFSLHNPSGRRKRWRTLKFPGSQKIEMSCSSVDLNGVLYWVSKRYGTHDNGAFIQPLDVATEKLMSIIKVPCKSRKLNCHLLKIKGSLCFMSAASDDDLHIWVLKDSVKSLWILQRKFSLQSMVHRPNCLTSFLFVRFQPWLVVETIKTTYVLVSIGDNSKPYWFNMGTEELSQIAVDYDGLNASHLHALSFTDFDSVPGLDDLGPKLLDLMLE